MRTVGALLSMFAVACGVSGWICGALAVSQCPLGFNAAFYMVTAYVVFKGASAVLAAAEQDSF